MREPRQVRTGGDVRIPITAEKPLNGASAISSRARNVLYCRGGRDGGNGAATLGGILLYDAQYSPPGDNLPGPSDHAGFGLL